MRISTTLSGLGTLAAAAGVSARFQLDAPPVTRRHELLFERQGTPTLSSTRTRSTLPPDPWQCVTENITQYFDVPKPTSNVLNAIGSYGDGVVKNCRATATGRAYVSCTVSDPKSWCGFTTAAPADILSSYSTYVSEVVSFWTAKSSTISILSTSCPVAWRRFAPHEHEWLKIATAHANCYLEAHGATQAAQPETTPPTLTTGDAPALTTATTSTAPTTGTSATTSGAGDRRPEGVVRTVKLMISVGLILLAQVA